MQEKTELIQPTIKGKFIIRPYEPSDEPQIIASWEEAFKQRMDAETWRWKYHANPAGFRTMLCLSETGDVAVHYAAQVYRITHNGQKKLALHLTDNFSHPAYRWALGGKTGLFVKTSWAFLKTYLDEIPIDPCFKLYVSHPKAHFHYGFPGQRHYRLGAKLMYYRLFKPGTLYFTFSDNKCPSKNSWISLQRCEYQDFPDPDGINKLWQEVLNFFNPFSVIRDYTFLKWRYFNKPNGNYAFFCLKNRFSKKMSAWLIAVSHSREVNTLRIVDFLAKDTHSMESLLKGFINENKGRHIECWCSENHPLKKAFLKAGFMPEDEPLGIVPCARCDETGISPDEADKFIWTMGDADLF